MVTAPFLPAWATISASRSCCLAFRTLCCIPRFFSREERYSLFSIEMVPTSTGWPFSWQAIICSMMALSLPASLLYTTSGQSLRMTGLFVGISMMSSS